MSNGKRMVFHVPFALNPEATSASGIRPIKMRQAFERIGYEVLEVSGPHRERKARMRHVNEQLRSGAKIDFVYSEAATTPTGLGEKVTRHTSLSRDINFLLRLRQRGIPVGLFYRDVYWQFDEYVERVGQPYASILQWRYRVDLRRYTSAVDTIFLPSMKMADYLPEDNQRQVSPLPPGTDIVALEGPHAGVRMLYVGGIGSYYRMQEAVAGVALSQGATLTICTRENEWLEARRHYEDLLGDSTRIVHRSGSELRELYAQSNVASLFVEPIGYRDFAAPLKLYEYLGHAKPIIATEGTLAAEFVSETGIGWSVPYGRDDLADLLNHLARHPEEVEAKRQRAMAVRHEHTWDARALQARDHLLGLELGQVTAQEKQTRG